MLYPSARKIQSRPGMLPIVLWWCLPLHSPCRAAVLWCYGSCLGSPQAVLRPCLSSLLNQTTFPRALLKPWLRPLSLLVWQLPHKGSARLCSRHHPLYFTPPFHSPAAVSMSSKARCGTLDHGTPVLGSTSWLPAASFVQSQFCNLTPIPGACQDCILIAWAE